jgi:membrane protease YdiL (CAAX protease family)
MSSPNTPGEPRTGQQLYHGTPFSPATAVKLTALAIVTIYAVQIVVGSLKAPVLVASVAGDVVVVALVLGIARSRGWTLRDFGIRATAPRFLVAAVLVGISMWFVTLTLVELVQPPGDTEEIENALKQTALVATLITLAIFPAVAEEIVFRGILTRALTQRFQPIGAIAISALVFAVFHLNPPQIVSTVLLGLALGYLTLRANSIVPAVIVHFLNNSIAIVLSRDEMPDIRVWIGAHTPFMLVASLVLVMCGLALAATKGAA